MDGEKTVSEQEEGYISEEVAARQACLRLEPQANLYLSNVIGFCTYLALISYPNGPLNHLVCNLLDVQLEGERKALDEHLSHERSSSDVNPT